MHPAATYDIQVSNTDRTISVIVPCGAIRHSVRLPFTTDVKRLLHTTMVATNTATAKHVMRVITLGEDGTTVRACCSIQAGGAPPPCMALGGGGGG